LDSAAGGQTPTGQRVLLPADSVRNLACRAVIYFGASSCSKSFTCVPWRLLEPSRMALFSTSGFTSAGVRGEGTPGVRIGPLAPATRSHSHSHGLEPAAAHQPSPDQKARATWTPISAPWLNGQGEEQALDLVTGEGDQPVGAGPVSGGACSRRSRAVVTRMTPATGHGLRCEPAATS
jgi:hypothetical protein